MNDYATGRYRNKLEKDKIAYGARCTWWDNKENVGTVKVDSSKMVNSSMTLPCCPHCKGMLFEMENIEVWQEQVDFHDREHPGYSQMITWAKGKCFPDLNSMVSAYTLDGGNYEN